MLNIQSGSTEFWRAWNHLLRPVSSRVETPQIKQSRRWKVLAIAAAAVLGVGGLPTAGAASAAGASPVHIRFSTGGATPPNEMEAAIFSPELQKKGILKGYDKDYTLSILTASKGTPQTLSLLAADQIDIGTLGFSTIALGQAKHAIKGGFSVIVAQFVDAHPGYGANAYMVLKNSGISGPADLKGKVIGTNQLGSASDIVLRAWLVNHKLDPRKDVQFVESGYATQQAALNSGRVALGTFVQPFEAMEQASGKAKILFTTAEATGETAAIAVVARNNFLKEHPKAVKSFLADWVAGLQWLAKPENRTEAIAIMSRITGTPANVLGLVYGVKGKDYYRDLKGCPSAKALQNGIDAMVKVGDLKTRVDVSKLVDASYLPYPC